MHSHQMSNIGDKPAALMLHTWSEACLSLAYFRRESTKNPRLNIVRRGAKRSVRDSNPGRLSPHSISSAAPSTTRTTLHTVLWDSIIFGGRMQPEKKDEPSRCTSITGRPVNGCEGARREQGAHEGTWRQGKMQHMPIVLSPPGKLPKIQNLLEVPPWTGRFGVHEGLIR